MSWVLVIKFGLRGKVLIYRTAIGSTCCCCCYYIVVVVVVIIIIIIINFFKQTEFLFWQKIQCPPVLRYWWNQRLQKFKIMGVVCRFSCEGGGGGGGGGWTNYLLVIPMGWGIYLGGCVLLRAWVLILGDTVTKLILPSPWLGVRSVQWFQKLGIPIS